MIGAGRRDSLVSFHSITTVENALGEPVQTGLSLLGQEWARIIYGRGDERRAAAIEGADQPATFNVLANSMTRAVTTKNVIQFDGDAWDIVSIAPLGRREIDFTAVRRAP